MRTSSRLDRIARAQSLVDLRARIEAVERHRVNVALPGVFTAWGRPIESLARGVLHEWCVSLAHPGQAWNAPLLLLAHLARQAMGDAERPHGQWVVWIGRRVWPQLHTLVNDSCDHRMIERSLLVDPSSDNDRLWAIDLCVRSAAVAAVIADGRGMNLAHSRRLQLAAESGNALTLLSCSSTLIVSPSAAVTRWRVESVPSATTRPRWRVELVRCKGVQRYSSMEADASVVLEHHRATGCVRIHAAMADRSTQATAQARRSA